MVKTTIKSEPNWQDSIDPKAEKVPAFQQGGGDSHIGCDNTRQVDSLTANALHGNRSARYDREMIGVEKASNIILMASFWRWFIAFDTLESSAYHSCY